MLSVIHENICLALYNKLIFFIIQWPQNLFSLVKGLYAEGNQICHYTGPLLLSKACQCLPYNLTPPKAKDRLQSVNLPVSDYSCEFLSSVRRSGLSDCIRLGMRPPKGIANYLLPFVGQAADYNR